MMKKVVFLDYDGVVNRKMWVKDGENWVCRFGYPSDGAVNDSQAVQWVSEFCEKYGYDIVVTSSWRTDSGYADCLRAAGLRESVKILGATSLPVRDRADEIIDYLSEHTDIERYLIFDDDESLFIKEVADDIFELKSEFCDNIVFCSEEHGFGEQEYNKAVATHLSLKYRESKDVAVPYDARKDEIGLNIAATELLYATGGLSTSMLQRKFKVGYGRAAKTMDFLIDSGIIFKDCTVMPVRYKPLIEFEEAMKILRKG